MSYRSPIKGGAEALFVVEQLVPLGNSFKPYLIE